MLNEPNIYAVIIGSEILDRRREDKHFAYFSSALKDKGFTLFASFIIKDDTALIEDIYSMIQKDPSAIMFSFGGIGSTPDDLTRALSAKVFSDGILYRHQDFEKAIIERLGERAYPHPIKMSDLPKDADLLFNPINNMSGYHLQKRYFFMPGFPEMAQPMMQEIISKYLPSPSHTHTKSFLAQCGEGKIQDLMTRVAEGVELSSLPIMNHGNANVEFSLSCKDETLLVKEFCIFTDFLSTHEIEYKLL